MTYPAARGNTLTDVAGLRVGHVDRRDGGYLTGTTVVLGPAAGMTAGVDVRGGAPGTRETDLLHPTASVQRIHAIVLTGGSAYGLAAACGVADSLGAAGIGFPVGDDGQVVPIVPAAVLFDLGRGGRFDARPGPEFGSDAVAAALADGHDDRIGLVGAGVGAVTAGLKGGLGMASAVLPDGCIVSAVVIANAAGSPIDPRNGELLAARTLLASDFPGLQTPTPADRDAVLAVLSTTGPHLRTPVDPTNSVPTLTNTSIGIVATDASLSKAQCTKMAETAHDGLARALNPVHTQFDGDTLFAVSDNSRPAPDEIGFHHILCAAADVVTRALARGLLSGVRTTTTAGEWPGYLDLAPSAQG